MTRAFDGALGLDDGFRLEEHVHHCADCRAEFELQTALTDGLAGQGEPPIERLDVERSLAAIHGELDAPVAPGPARWSRGGPWKVAAALLLAAGGGLLLLEENGQDPEPGPPVDDAVALEDGSALEELDPPAHGSVAVHPLLPAEGTLTNLDVDRHALVHDRVRQALLAAANRYPVDASEVNALVEYFEQGVEDLIRQDWPLSRLVAGLVDDPDVLVAEAACRYTGRRATRLGVARLEDALEGPVKVAATLALADAGRLGELGLARALWDPDLTSRVRAAIRELPVEARLEWAEHALAYAPADPAAGRIAAGRIGAEAWIDLTVAAGDGGLRLLFDQLGDPRLPSSGVLEGLARGDLAHDELGTDLLLERLQGRVADSDVPVLLDAVEFLHPLEALAFVRAQAWSGRHRVRAAKILGVFPGVGPLYALLELDEGRRVGVEDLAQAWRAALTLEPTRVLTLAVEQAAVGDRAACRRLLENLALAQHPAAVPALVELVARGALAGQDRERAALLAAELGSAEHAPLLLQAFYSFTSRDRDVAAACLLALHRLGGEGYVTRALDDVSDRRRERVSALLSQESRTTTLLIRLARELEPVLASHEAFTWRTTR
jgi:hypothetical protein